MARYIDADKLLKDLCTVSAPTPSESWIVEKCIEKVNEQPTADVVPKSEAENYKKIAEHQQSVSMRRYFEIKQLKEELAKTKQEVAREIIKDLVKFADDKERHFHGHGVWYIDADDVTDFITERKKKYLVTDTNVGHEAESEGKT